MFTTKLMHEKYSNLSVNLESIQLNSQAAQQLICARGIQKPDLRVPKLADNNGKTTNSDKQFKLINIKSTLNVFYVILIT